MQQTERRSGATGATRNDIESLWRKVRNAMTFRFFMTLVACLVTVGWGGYKVMDRLTVVETKAAATDEVVREHSKIIYPMQRELTDFHQEFRDWAGLPKRRP